MNRTVRAAAVVITIVIGIRPLVSAQGPAADQPPVDRVRVLERAVDALTKEVSQLSALLLAEQQTTKK